MPEATATPAAPAKKKFIPDPQLGESVRFVISEGPKAGQVRHAVITGIPTADDARAEFRADFPTLGIANLAVFVGSPKDFKDNTNAVLTAWAVRYDSSRKPGTWHREDDIKG